MLFNNAVTMGRLTHALGALGPPELLLKNFQFFVLMIELPFGCMKRRHQHCFLKFPQLPFPCLQLALDGFWTVFQLWPSRVNFVSLSSGLLPEHSPCYPCAPIHPCNTREWTSSFASPG